MSQQSGFGQAASPGKNCASANTPPSPTTSGANSEDNAAALQQAQLLAANNGGFAPILGRLMNNPVGDDAPLVIPPPSVPLPSMENIPLTDIRTPHPNDVLCGRGGGTNNHAGNEKFRDLVNQQKVRYLHSSKRDKPYVSRGIVRAVRIQSPPGRFLQKNERTGFWYDIGDQKAREKTSQALREGAPDIRREITTQYGGGAAAASHMPFPPPIAATAASMAAANAPPPLASALLNATRQAAMAAAAQRQFDPMEMERHMRNVRLAEAAMLDNSALAAAAAEGSDVPPSMSRAVSAMQEQQQKSAEQKQPSQQQQQQAGSVPNATALQQAMAAAAAAGIPFGASAFSQLRQSNLLEQARVMSSLPNDAARAAAVRASLGASNPFAAAANSPLLNSFPSASLAAAARARGLNPFLGAAAAGNAFCSPASSAATATTTTTSPAAAPRLGSTPSAAALQADTPNPVVMTNPRPSISSRFGPSTEAPKAVAPPPPLTEDMALKLVFAETVAQKTTNGSITQDLVEADKISGLYVEAGLLGIDPNDMAKYLEQGHSEQEIADQHYKLQAGKNKENEDGDDKETNKDGDKKVAVKDDDTKGKSKTEKGDNGDDKKEEESSKDDEGSDEAKKDSDKDEEDKDDEEGSKKRPATSSDETSMPSLKKAKLEVWTPDPSRNNLTSTERRIHDALICIGAIN